MLTAWHQRLGRVCSLLASWRCAWTATLLLAWLVTAAACSDLAAQEPKPNSGNDGSPAARKLPSGISKSQLPGEVGPDVYYLKNEKGELLPVVNVPIEEFMDLFKLKNHLDPQEQRPAYTLKSLTIAGAANAKYADLKVEIAVVVHEDGPVKVPLRLASAALTQPIKFEGPGEQHLHFNAEGGDGYACWIDSTSGTTHKLTMQMTAPLVMLGTETQLKLTVPRANISSLKLEVPVEKAVATLLDAGKLEDPKSSPGKTELNAVGFGGEFQISWREPEAQVAGIPAVLEATGAILARIDSRSVNTEAKITVRSFGGPFNQLKIRLPANSQLVNSTPQGAVQGQLLDIKLDKKTQGPVEVRIVTDRPRNAASTTEILEFAGFDVVGAVRQWGHIAVQPVGSWQVAWGESRNIRQVDELPESLRRDDLAGGFEYHTQPCSLTARVAPQKTRVSASPEYVFLVGAQQVEMQARIRYRVRGAKVRSVDIELPGWEIDEVGPPNLVRIDAGVDNDLPAYTVPFSQPLSGEFEVTIAAHRAIPEGSKQLDLELPRARAEVLGPAIVAVLAADNVELAPVANSMSGLSVPPLKPQLTLPARQQEPLYFRSETSSAKFVAGFAVHPQSITSEVIGRVDLDDQEMRVEERLVYGIYYEPLDSLTIQVPAVVPLDKIAVNYGGERLSPVPLPDPAGGDRPSVLPMRISLPSAQIGRCELLVSYVLPLEKLAPATSVGVSVPLVMPSDGKLLRNQVAISAKPNLTVSTRRSAWREEGTRGDPRGGGLSLVADEVATELPLAVTQTDRQIEESTIVDRAWIQTWLTESARQDRVLFRFTTNQRRIKLSLPAGIVRPAIEAYVDGARVTPDAETTGEISLPVTQAGGRRERLIELRYHFPQRDRTSHLSFESPQFVPATWVRRLYWQVILPSNEHLVYSPGALTREYRWNWNKIYWARKSALEQSDLESWIGVNPIAGPPESANQYLFSTVGSTNQLDIWTARRSVLVFTASMLVLGFGLLLIYVPALRHPGLFLVVAVFVTGVAVLEPEAAVLLAQAAGLGMALTVIAVLLARKSLCKVLPVTPMRGSSFVVRDRSGTELYFRPGKTGHSSTATAPTAAVSGPEEKP